MNNLSDYKYPEFNEDFEGMVPVSGGGGSGGSGSGTMKVTFTNDNGTIVADKTFSEVYEAIQSGILVYANYALPDGVSIPSIYYLDVFDSFTISFTHVSISMKNPSVRIEVINMSTDGIEYYTLTYPAS